MSTHRVRAGTFADGLVVMTDREYAERVDNSPPIGDAYRHLGRRGSPSATACAYASVFGIRSRISGATRGDPSAESVARGQTTLAAGVGAKRHLLEECTYRGSGGM
jgi:hypothetical protein